MNGVALGAAVLRPAHAHRAALTATPHYRCLDSLSKRVVSMTAVRRGTVMRRNINQVY